MNLSLWTGFEPARVDPNGFQVHRLNHSATTAVVHVLCTVCIVGNFCGVKYSLFSWAGWLTSTNIFPTKT